MERSTTEQVHRGSATTTRAVRAAIQPSKASIAELSREPGINPKTVAKWRRGQTIEDQKTGPESRVQLFFEQKTKPLSSLPSGRRQDSASCVYEKEKLFFYAVKFWLTDFSIAALGATRTGSQLREKRGLVTCKAREPGSAGENAACRAKSQIQCVHASRRFCAKFSAYPRSRTTGRRVFGFETV